MSLISEQVDALRLLSKATDSKELSARLKYAADAIEELSKKLASANMEKSEQHYDNDYVKVIRCKDCRQWGTGFPAETEYGKVCRYAGYMVGANGYCVYGEKK